MTKYDKYGRMNYDPQLHDHYYKPWTEEEVQYLCEHYGADGPANLAYALGRTDKAIAAKVTKLRRQGFLIPPAQRHVRAGREEANA